MCYFLSVNFSKEEIEQGLGTEFDDTAHYEPNFYFNAFSLPYLPIISNDKKEIIQLFQWGLIPSWVKDEGYAEKIRLGTFNAKAETITEKSSFKIPVRTKRCLVMCSGFFEWQTVNNKKYPYYIQLKNNQVMTFAGIFDNWQNKSTGEIHNTFSIITTSANQLLEKVHNVRKRMPVILKQGEEKLWLDMNVPLSNSLKLLQPYDEKKMKAHTVSPLITGKGVDKNVPDLIKPYAYSNLPPL